MSERRSLGKLLRLAREAKGLSLEGLARDLNLQESVLRSLEADVYEQLPTGGERPLVRQVAERLEVDLAQHQEAWEALPGSMAEESPDPKRERLERIVMGALTAGSIGLLAWLAVPGPNLKRGALDEGQSQITGPRGGLQPAAEVHPQPQGGRRDYPVLGEALPEVPRSEEGLLVILRAQDASPVHIVADGLDEKRTLQVSGPWLLRVKGAFTITLDNAGVVSVEVAGRTIRHGQSVGETWVGRFNAEGQWLRPKAPEEPPPTVPEVDPEAPSGRPDPS
ncbi:MAG: helix-turn-helix domain-containing protein [Holophagaceae bacterium]|nr:helix-turn-helix domain-containing protein [Holophagaceae bacterium]